MSMIDYKAKRVIIYGLGQVYESAKNLIEWDNVVACADKSGRYETLNEKAVVTPDKIELYEYDYIVVFSNKLFCSIKNELVIRYGIDSDRIISYRMYIGDMTCAYMERREIYKSIFSMYGIRKLLNISSEAVFKDYYTRESVFGTEDIVIDGLECNESTQLSTFYNRIYSDKEQVNIAEEYDAVISLSVVDMKQLETYAARYLIICCDAVTSKDMTGYDYQEIYNIYGTIWVVNLARKRGVSYQDSRIYVVSHKEVPVYKNDLYYPIGVGGRALSYTITDKTGDNISELNNRINECTALYWIWKNTRSDVVGLCHYRRYFANEIREKSTTVISRATVDALLEKNDIILASSYIFNESVYEQLCITAGEEIAKKAYGVVREKLLEYQPEYEKAFDEVMSRRGMYPCNMLITRWDIYDRYCEWLFSFIIPAARSMCVDGLSTNDQRIVGFFAERMMSVWLKHEQFRVKELPFTMIDM